MTKVLSSMEKKAAYDALLKQGVAFDAAIKAVEKQAGLMGEVGRVGSVIAGKAKTFATAMKNDAGHVADQVRAVKTGKTVLDGARYKSTVSIDRGAALKQLAGNKAVQGGAAVAGTAAVGAAMANPSRQQEKQACLNELLAQGIAFDAAVALVKQAEQDIYGK